MCWGPVEGNNDGNTDDLLPSTGASTWLLAVDLVAEWVDARRSLTGRNVAGCRRNAFTEARDGRGLVRESGRRRGSGLAPMRNWKGQGHSSKWCEITYRSGAFSQVMYRTHHCVRPWEDPPGMEVRMRLTLRMEAWYVMGLTGMHQ